MSTFRRGSGGTRINLQEDFFTKVLHVSKNNISKENDMKYLYLVVIGMLCLIPNGSNIFGQMLSLPNNDLSADVMESWVANYSSNLFGGSTEAMCMVMDTTDGSIYIAMKAFITFYGYDYLIYKYNINDQTSWTVRYNGTGCYHDVPTAIALDATGNIVVTGYSWGTDGNYDYATTKVSSTGTLMWTSRYNGTGNGADTAKGLAIDRDGNIYITGVSYGSGNFDYTTLKYDTNGVQKWLIRYNGTGNDNDIANAISIDTSKNVYVTGASRNNSGNFDFVTIKYNSSGTQQWERTFNGTNNGDDISSCMVVSSTGDVIVTGVSSYFTNKEWYTIKYSSNGTTRWELDHGGNFRGSSRNSVGKIIRV
ncbi:MAG: SBBP repeat-containing protein [Ignavibacteriae bacterium]|nr:SBBP repeat-containing protein [Ignavibacteriota bacterium]